MVAETESINASKRLILWSMIRPRPHMSHTCGPGQRSSMAELAATAPPLLCPWRQAVGGGFLAEK